MGQATAAIMARMGLDSSDFEKGLKGAHSKVDQHAKGMERSLGAIADAAKNVGEAIGIGLGVGAIIEAGKSMIEFATNIKHASEELDLSTDSYQGLIAAVRQGGGTVEQFEKAYGTLIQTVERARNGDENAVDTLKRLGLTWQQIKSLSVEQIFYKIADSVKNSNDKAQTFTDIADAMGKTGKKLIPILQEGGDAIQKFGDSASKLSSDAIEKAHQLETQWKDVWNNIEVATINNISKMSDALADFYTKAAYGVKPGETQAPSAGHEGQTRRNVDSSVDKSMMLLMGGNYNGQASQAGYTDDDLKKVTDRMVKDIERLKGIKTKPGSKIFDQRIAALEKQIKDNNAALDASKKEAGNKPTEPAKPAPKPGDPDFVGPVKTSNDDDPTAIKRREVEREIAHIQLEASRSAMDRATRVLSLDDERKSNAKEMAEIDLSTVQNRERYYDLEKANASLDAEIARENLAMQNDAFHLAEQIEDIKLKQAREGLSPAQLINSLEEERMERMERIAELEKSNTTQAEAQLAVEKRKTEELAAQIKQAKVAEILKSPEQKSEERERARREQQAGRIADQRNKNKAAADAANVVDGLHPGHMASPGHMADPKDRKSMMSRGQDIKKGVDAMKSTDKMIQTMNTNTFNASTFNVSNFKLTNK